MKTHLVFALMTVLLLIFAISQTGRRTFSFDDVVRQARELSIEPYTPRAKVGSERLQTLGYDGTRDIRMRQDATLWQDKGLPFQVRFILAAGIHSEPITVFQINREGAGEVRFDVKDFDFGMTGLNEGDAENGGFAGFRIFHPINKPDQLDEVMVFLGASYFRAVARDQVWGISARGIALSSGLPDEEFPAFTRFWLVTPSQIAGEVTVFALLDGPSVTGAFEFKLRPGQETQIDVRTAIFARKDVEDLGLAPLTSMYWYGENTSNTFGDFRPEVHDSDGLQVENANGEWLWRPLAWSQQLQMNQFSGPIKGFGLFQRDRDFSHYQDLEAKYHLRPSVWVQPKEEWRDGFVKLVQIPTDGEYMDNVVAYWVPKGGLLEGQRRDAEYRIIWFTDNGGLPPVGRCVATRIDYQEQRYYRQVIVDFDGGPLDNLAANAAVEADLWISENAQVSDIQVQRNEFDGSWRVTFTPYWGRTNAAVEMRCSLRSKETGEPLTETWTYTWVP